MGKIKLAIESSDPSYTSGFFWLYPKSGGWYIEDGSGNVTQLIATGLPLGLTGAVAATRYVGGTTSGAPITGTFAVGDFVIDQTGHVYICTVAGSPGTWVTGGGTTYTGTAPISVSGSAISFAPDGSTAKATPVAADEVVIGDSAASFAPKKSTFTQIMAQLGIWIDAFPEKATPVDADETNLSDSASSNAAKKITLTHLWANYLLAKAQAIATDAFAALTDITTNNASTSAHGFAPKAVAPASGALNAVGIANGETVYTNKGVVAASAGAMTGATTADEILFNDDAITAIGNAATIPVTKRIHTVTNNSAATLTITLTKTSAVKDQLQLIKILDYSGAAQTITWVNTENSGVSAPTTSNGSTTLPLCVGFIWNDLTSLWRCIGYA